jgi:protein-S-isoprenylcysteine O-methyltransferase Ste14
MRASHIEFRLRMVIMATIVFVGFWSPWIKAWSIGQHISLLEWCALELSRFGILSFTVATPVMIVCAAAIAALAALLRVWGTAWLGSSIVNNRDMKAGVVMTGGPYRYVRNPLYLGTGLMVVAMSFVMPVTGAVFSLILLTIFLLRLILGEEAFLAGQFGEPYRQYLRCVPRLFPRLRSNLPAPSERPQWGRALLAEANPIGVFLILAILSWRYNSSLMIKALLISFGISLVLRAFLPTSPSAQYSTENPTRR